MKRNLEFGWLVLALVALAYIDPVWAQNQVMLRPESVIRIDGRSTVNTFSCKAGEVRGFGKMASSRTVRKAVQVASRDGAMVEIIIPVASFDCGQERMNRDLLSALQARQHPTIRYRLDQAELLDASARGQAYLLQTTGQLTIAGTERTVDITVTGRIRQDGMYEVGGAVALQMSDFGIDPPTALLGMIKVRDEIIVRFDLLAAPAGRGSAGDAAAGGS